MVALTNSGFGIDSSTDSTLLDGLNDEQVARLTNQLDRYLRSLEQGNPLDATELVHDNADLASVIFAYLQKLNTLYGIAVGFDPGITAALDAPEPLSSLGDFKLIREIGRGGMGIVYEAQQVTLDRKVAVKLLPMTSLSDSRQITRFKNEARAAGLLHHPHIVPVYSVGAEKGLHYFAMQHIDGVSMDDWIKDASFANSHGISWTTIVSWAIDIAEALHAAHETGIVHRDVKPSNLMLDRHGKIWITDFGLARCHTETSLTRSGELIGTMRYMSPEQARGQTALVDGRSDIYSLAVTLYEILTRRPAHLGDDAATILRAIDEQDVPPVQRLCSDLPRDLGTVIAKAMSVHRDGRYDTAGEFADDLRRVLAGNPTLARPATALDRLGRWAAKHRQTVLACSLLCITGLVGFATSTAMIAAEKRNSDAAAMRAEDGERRARRTVDSVAQVAELLADIPAASQVRRLVLAQILEYHLEFVASAADDPKLRQDLAVTYAKIGALHSELGANQDAVRALRESEKLYGEISRRRPTDLHGQLNWSTSQNNLAEVLQRNGELENAARYYTRAAHLQRRLVELADTQQSEEMNRSSKLALSITLHNLGLLLAQTDAVDEAEKSYLEAIDLLIPLLGGDSGDDMVDRLVAMQTNLSGLLTKSNPRQAVEMASDAMSRQIERLEKEPGNAKRATQAIATLNAIGSAQLQREQHEAAIRALQHAIEIGDQLLNRWPEQPTYRRDYVISMNHLGLALSRSGRLRDARTAFEKALAHERPLAKAFSADAETQSILGGVLNNLGFLQQQLGDLESAAHSYRQAITAQSIAVRLAPEVKRYREYLSKHQENYRAAAANGASS